MQIEMVLLEEGWLRKRRQMQGQLEAFDGGEKSSGTTIDSHAPEAKSPKEDPQEAKVQVRSITTNKPR
jgi:hypothetical protein